MIAAILQKPIGDIDEGKRWVEALCQSGRMFHFDDSPETIINCASGERLFSDTEAEIIRNRIAELYSLDWGDSCPIGYALTVLE